MTGHNNSIQNQTPTFLTTLQATLDILDDISGRIDENTYLTLANNLQQLHNIHTSNSTSTSTSNPPIITSINHSNTDYTSTISYASLRNFELNNLEFPPEEFRPLLKESPIFFPSSSPILSVPRKPFLISLSIRLVRARTTI